MIQQTISFIESHQALLPVVSAWAVREAHIWWPRLLRVYPYARANGGVCGIAKQFLFGTGSKPVLAEAQPQPK